MISGELCYLRAVEPSDLDLIYHWENDESLWVEGSTRQPVSCMSIETLIAQADMDIYQTRQMRLMVCSKADGRVVGCVDMFDFSPFDMRAALGVMIAEEYRRSGFATEALRLMCGYLKETLSLHQVYVSIRVSNVASVALFSKLGFDRIGVRRQWLKTSSGYEDEMLMQLILE